MSEHAFSADVRLTLRLSDQDISLAQVGPAECIVRGDYGQLPIQEGTLVVKIDDHINETRVRLLTPIEGVDCRVGYERLVGEPTQSVKATA